jgi:glutamate dehydrogenase
MPAAIANEIAVIKLLSSASDIVNISRKSHDDVAEIAPAYFMVGEHLGLDWLRNQVAGIVPTNAWQARVMGGLMDDYFIHQAAITAAIFASVSQKTKVDRKIVSQWLDHHVEMVSKINQLVGELRDQPKVELEMLVLVSQRIGQLVHVVN